MVHNIKITRELDGMVRFGFRLYDTIFVGKFTGTREEFERAGWTIEDVQ